MLANCLTLLEMNSSSQLTFKKLWSRDWTPLLSSNNFLMMNLAELLLFTRMLQSLTWYLTLPEWVDQSSKHTPQLSWLFAKCKLKYLKKTRLLITWVKSLETNFTLKTLFMSFKQVFNQLSEQHSTDLCRWASSSKLNTLRLMASKLVMSKSMIRTKTKLKPTLTKWLSTWASTKTKLPDLRAL